MEEKIENMSEDIEEAKQNAMQLTNEQRIAAGEALYDIVGDTNITKIEEVKQQYLDDIQTPQNNLGVNFDPAQRLQNVYNGYIYFDELETLYDKKEDIYNDTLEIDNNLSTLDDKSETLINRIQNYKSSVAENLPEIAQTIELYDPVDTGTVQSVNFDTFNVEIPVGGTIDTELASQNESNTNSMKTDIKAYKDSMLAQSENIIDDLVYADSILYTGDVSVNSLSIDYYHHSHKLSINTAAYLRYYEKLKRTYSGKNTNLFFLRETIDTTLKAQANALETSQLDSRINARIALINYLLGETGAGSTTEQDISTMDPTEKREYCVTLGKEIWYHIPYNGMHSIVLNTHNELMSFSNNFNNNRNQFFQQWGNIGNSVEMVHNVKSETYEYLYDLYDAMSWEYENGGPQQNLNNNAAQITPNGYQFGGNLFNNINGMQNLGGNNYFQDMGGGLQGGIGGQNQGNLGDQYQHIDADYATLVQGLKIGTAAKEIREHDTYSTKREYINDISFPPSVKHFNGSFDSKEESYGYYGILTLDYEAEHSTGGCFYNINISDVTNGPISLGIGKKPAFYLFRTLDPPSNYNISLTSFANTGYNITNTVNLPVDYFSIGYDEYEGGDYHTEFDNADNTKPLAPVFQTAYYSAKQDEVIFNYIAEDPESGIAEYQYAIADSVWYEYTTLGAPPRRQINYIRNWESTGGRTEINIRGLASEHNDTYYILGKAKNGAGMWSIASVSEKIKVDTSGPNHFRITNFEVTKKSTQTLTHQTLPTYEFSARWTEAQDPESEVVYIVGLGTSEGSDDLVNFGPVYNNQQIIQDQIFQTESVLEEFYITIKAVNTSGIGNMESRVYNTIKQARKKNTTPFNNRKKRK